MADRDPHPGDPSDPNAHQRGDHPAPPPAVPPGNLPALPPAGQPPLGPEDTEQWRKFQEFQRFQQFQEFQRTQGDELPGETSRPKRRGKPLWVRVLRSRWFRRLVYVIVFVLLLNWAYDHFFGNPDEDLPASVTGGSKARRTVLFATSPKVAVRMVYDNIAQEVLPDACTRFESEEVEMQFARHFNAPDCATAVHRLHADVTDVTRYSLPRFPPRMDLTPGPDGSVVISSCEMEVHDGPRLGRFTVKVIPGSRADQWTITRHDAEPDPCPVPSPPTR
ncbi:hypothetical protein [Actinokineospora enzanensis]|uniref:hypothetical protein n=1 Tax=Actinokineospora enzanensis TaxID=155975 RepID=UPI0012EC1FD5|nr:hypothetical protein [Actinokineospora enzanensis]